MGREDRLSFCSVASLCWVDRKFCLGCYCGHLSILGSFTEIKQRVVLSLSYVRLLWPHRLYVAHKAPLSMGFPRQEYWSELPFPSPGDLPDPGLEPRSPELQAVFCIVSRLFTDWATREAKQRGGPSGHPPWIHIGWRGGRRLCQPIRPVHVQRGAPKPLVRMGALGHSSSPPTLMSPWGLVVPCRAIPESQGSQASPGTLRGILSSPAHLFLSPLCLWDT